MDLRFGFIGFEVYSFWIYGFMSFGCSVSCYVRCELANKVCKNMRRAKREPTDLQFVVSHSTLGAIMPCRLHRELVIFWLYHRSLIFQVV